MAQQVLQLAQENVRLREEVARLRAFEDQVTTALGTGGGVTRGSRSAPRSRTVTPAVAEPRPKRTRKPITDPVLLDRRRQALAKARAARAEKLAAERAEASPALNGVAEPDAAEAASAEGVAVEA